MAAHVLRLTVTIVKTNKCHLCLFVAYTLKRFTVRVSDTINTTPSGGVFPSFDKSTICGGSADTIGAGAVARVDCPADTRGRYLFIVNTFAILTMCEVEVYGYPGKSCICISTMNLLWAEITI